MTQQLNREDGGRPVPPGLVARPSEDDTRDSPATWPSASPTELELERVSTWLSDVGSRGDGCVPHHVWCVGLSLLGWPQIPP